MWSRNGLDGALKNFKQGVNDQTRGFKGNSGKEAWKKVNGGGWVRAVAGGGSDCGEPGGREPNALFFMRDD